MKPGTMCAIMVKKRLLKGPSGCGKTTLLGNITLLIIDILAGRKYSGEISGKICVNSVPRQLSTFKRKSAYVTQVLMFYIRTMFSFHFLPSKRLYYIQPNSDYQNQYLTQKN